MDKAVVDCLTGELTSVSMSADEEKAYTDEVEAWVADAPKRATMSKIRELEGSVTPRRIREMTTDAGKKWVEDVEKLIATERAKL
jgi:predicted secreted protein